MSGMSGVEGDKLIRVSLDVWMRAKAACPYLGVSLKAFTEGAIERRLEGLKAEGAGVDGRQVVEVSWGAGVPSGGGKEGLGATDLSGTLPSAESPAVTNGVEMRETVLPDGSVVVGMASRSDVLFGVTEAMRRAIAGVPPEIEAIHAAVTAEESGESGLGVDWGAVGAALTAEYVPVEVARYQVPLGDAAMPPAGGAEVVEPAEPVVVPPKGEGELF